MWEKGRVNDVTCILCGKFINFNKLDTKVRTFLQLREHLHVFYCSFFLELILTDNLLTISVKPANCIVFVMLL
jgi:hypothetical protein